MKHVTLIQQISNLLQIDDIKMQSFELYKSMDDRIYIKFKVDIGKGYMQEFNFKMQDILMLKSLFDKIAFHGSELLMGDIEDE